MYECIWEIRGRGFVSTKYIDHDDDKNSESLYFSPAAGKNVCSQVNGTAGMETMKNMHNKISILIAFSRKALLWRTKNNHYFRSMKNAESACRMVLLDANTQTIGKMNFI